MRAETVLYHYSPLLHLPPVLREGLSVGDVAHPDPRVRVTAVSLTTQTDPERLGCWGDPAMLSFKTAVRYVCRLRDADLARLEPQRRTWTRLGVNRGFQKRLDNQGQAKWWSHYFGTIPREQFEVQLRGKAGYVTPTGPDLERTADLIDRERQNYEFFSPPEAPYILGVRSVCPSHDPWLLKDGFPAERFGCVPTGTPG